MTDILRKATGWMNKFIPAAEKQVEKTVVKGVAETAPNIANQLLGALPGRVFIRIAGISGVLAVILGAYGAHAFVIRRCFIMLYIEQLFLTFADAIMTFETGNRYHLLHTIALLGVPLTRKPHLVGTLMVVGMLLFSGSCYYHALAEITSIRKVTPYGGMMLIAAWAAVAL